MTERPPQSMWQRVSNTLKACDALGYKVKLKYQDSSTFTSPIGGLVSLIAYLGVFAYFI